jgi:hypothetical protein
MDSASPQATPKLTILALMDFTAGTFLSVV